jgi:hypothetical protein
MVPYTVMNKVPYTVTEMQQSVVCKKVKVCTPEEVTVKRCRVVPVCVGPENPPAAPAAAPCPPPCCNPCCESSGHGSFLGGLFHHKNDCCNPCDSCGSCGPCGSTAPAPKAEPIAPPKAAEPPPAQ